MTATAELPAGFSDKVLAAQSTFRAVMEAMARPGSVQRVTAGVGAPAPMMRATAAIALTLFDHDTPVWLDHRMAETALVRNWLRFHTGAPVVDDESVCQFAIAADGAALPDFDRLSFGSDEYPDRSTTLIVQARGLTAGQAFELRGPGIDGAAVLCADFEPGDLFERLSVNANLFPRGIDLILVHDDAIVAIPRTTRLTRKGD